MVHNLGRPTNRMARRHQPRTREDRDKVSMEGRELDAPARRPRETDPKSSAVSFLGYRTSFYWHCATFVRLLDATSFGYPAFSKLLLDRLPDRLPQVPLGRLPSCYSMRSHRNGRRSLLSVSVLEPLLTDREGPICRGPLQSCVD